jgi:hypothetical protein
MNNRGKGGVGTNQYQIKGIPKASIAAQSQFPSISEAALAKRAKCQAEWETHLDSLPVGDRRKIQSAEYLNGKPLKDRLKAIHELTLIKEDAEAIIALGKDYYLDHSRSSRKERRASKDVFVDYVTVVTETFPMWWQFAHDIDYFSLREVRNGLHEFYNIDWLEILDELHKITVDIEDFDLEPLKLDDEPGIRYAKSPRKTRFSQ